MSVDRDRRVALIENLRRQQAAGRLRVSAVRRAAALEGVSARSIYRWIKRGVPDHRRPRYEVTERDREALAEAVGCFAAAHRRRKAEQARLPSGVTWARALRRDLAPHEIAKLRDGEQAARSKMLYPRWELSARNELWEMDSTQLPLLATENAQREPVKTWFTVVLDAYSRAIMGWTLSLGSVDTSDVLAALYQGIRVAPERGPLGGVPAALRFDNARVHLSNDFSRALFALGVDPYHSDPYEPRQKPKVERFFGTFKSSLRDWPLWGNGPRDVAGRRYQPKVDAPRVTTVAGYLEAKVDEYNKRAHSSLGGMSPADRWTSDATPVTEVEPASLAFLLARRETRTVMRDGISFRSQRFVSPLLATLVDERVEIAYTQNDLSSVEVFHRGVWLCTATSRHVTTGERQQLFTLRSDGKKRASNLLRAKTRRAGTQMRAINDAVDGLDPARRRRPPSSSRPSNTSLLDLPGSNT